MYQDELFFRGTHLVRYLADRLFKATTALLSVPLEDFSETIKDDVYEAYSLKALVMHENNIEERVTTGYRDSNPFLARPARPDSYYAVKCKVTEYLVPFEGDLHLFGFTTGLYPFYPYGRLEDNCFVISMKEGEENFHHDLECQLVLLRLHLKECEAAVKCFNSDLRKMIYGEA